MPPITVTKLGDSGEFLARIKGIGKIATYVGIPSDSASGRTARLVAKSLKYTSPRKSRQKQKARLSKIAEFNQNTNATLLYWFSKGSALRNQPPRPVLEAAIHAQGNKEQIASLVALSVAADLAGKNYVSQQLLIQAGARAAKACRDWFTDPRNNWAPNAFNTSRKKGSDQPGIDTNIMRSSITHVEKIIG